MHCINPPYRTLVFENCGLTINHTVCVASQCTVSYTSDSTKPGMDSWSGRGSNEAAAQCVGLDGAIYHQDDTLQLAGTFSPFASSHPGHVACLHICHEFSVGCDRLARVQSQALGKGQSVTVF